MPGACQTLAFRTLLRDHGCARPMNCSFRIFALPQRLGVSTLCGRCLLASRPNLVAQLVCAKFAIPLFEPTYDHRACTPNIGSLTGDCSLHHVVV
jgi:hypothetical protein